MPYDISNTNPNIPEEHWDVFVEVFRDYKKFTSKIEARLNSIGCRIVYNNVHVKIFYKNACMIISAAPSDRQAGRQILRTLRKLVV